MMIGGLDELWRKVALLVLFPGMISNDEEKLQAWKQTQVCDKVPICWKEVLFYLEHTLTLSA